ncbi:SPOR domain-containing protein [Sphingomonas aracearum]|uniref:SPOR domain-containing protein n=1 Tax=Sphingomonas aracearum TaxID=2283317 RepID=A0A369VWT2_9SPHN|nr:SPOR domain-containing protein [Sphingomonas aracearum]RDE06846.1 SPOR domain-containing protein [Sphingomonas aracearum]
MTLRAAIALGASALVLGGIAAAGVTAADHGDAKTLKAARQEAGRAGKLLDKARAEEAVAHAEAAVRFAPQVASYRTLLGLSYMKAGRFTSAHSAFADALTLDPQDGRAALNLALAQIAEGQWSAARETLDANARTIAPSDRGLAIALAGDPSAAVEILGAAVRAPDADAKTRQNFALALALAGQWQMAKTMVSVDLPPLEADKRIMHWAQFAKPKSASDQVASLLGVQPVMDAGMPVALALNAPVGVAEAAPVEAFMPGQSAGKAVVEIAVPAPALPGKPVEVAAAPAELNAAAVAIRFAAPREVLQALPARSAPVLVARAPYKARLASAPSLATVATDAPARGNYYVQLGAFQSASVARDRWAAIRSRAPLFAAYQPQGVNASVKGGSFYRLSVGGFPRGEATRLCASWRAKGGKCFVRIGAGDQMAAWLKAGMQVASR